MSNKLFSVIILHYNQPRYVFTAIDSVLKQNYQNIELIFADDASTSLNLEEIKEYIESNKKENIKNVIYSINEVNQGTVKTINRAVKRCSGDYILFFAADDALADEKVIKNFSLSFKKFEQNIYMVSSQCSMMDIYFKEKLGDFVHPTAAKRFNDLSAKGQFDVFCNSCFLAIGATAMRREMFEKFGYFNEQYKFVEDWSYFLHLTRNGGLIKYVDFNGLLHRDGGVSHYTSEDSLPPHVMAYKYDIIKICENEILPYINKSDSKVVYKTLMLYEGEKQSYKSAAGTGKALPLTRLICRFPSFYINRMLYPITKDSKWLLSTFKASISLSVVFLAFFAAAFLIEPFKAVLRDIAIIIFICIFLSLLACTCIAAIKLAITLLRIIRKLFKRNK